MERRKLIFLQRHRLKAFNATLLQIEANVIQDRNFLLSYSDVFRFPKAIAKQNLKRYNELLHSMEKLKNYER